MDWEKRRFFVYMAASAYHVILNEVENRVFRHNHILRHTCIYKQSILTKWWTVISNTLIRSWMKKVHEEFLCGTSIFLAAHPPSCIILYRFFVLPLPFRLLRFYVEKNFAPEYGGRAGAPYPQCQQSWAHWDKGI